MSSESDEKLVSKMVRGHRYDHAQHLVLNPRGLSDRFYRNKARKGSSDSEPISDSDPLNSKEGLEPVQDIKKVPALVANDLVESDYNGENGDESKEANEDSDEETSDESESDDSDGNPDNGAASISFGALAKAQEIFGKRKQGNAVDIDDKSPEIRKRSKTAGEWVDIEALERKAGKKDMRDFSRASKHAPTELSSKKAVSRKRSVVPTKKVDHRDPRFDPLSGVIDEQKLKKNYSFLDTYRDNEMAELKTAIRKTKDSETKEKLKRALLSMESRKKAQAIKDQQQDVLRKHRKEEKGKIEQGKKPFYLKKADQKKIALLERFEGMKSKQVDKVIERRRKKFAAKERKFMPDERRG